MSDFTFVTKIDDHNNTSIGDETDSLLDTQHMSESQFCRTRPQYLERVCTLQYTIITRNDSES